MRIRSARPVRMEPGRRGFVPIAKFNLEVTEDVTVYDCTLVRAPDGNVLVYGPRSRTMNDALSLSPSARRRVIEMAQAAMGEQNASTRH